MNKELISLLVSLCLVLVSVFNVYASSQIKTTRINAIEANVADIRVNKNVDSFVLMKNFSGETEAVYFSLSDGGYVVASYKDGHVIEYSPQEFSGLIEVIDEQTIYYGGPHLFCTKNGMEFYDLLSEISFTATDDFYNADVYSGSVSTVSGLRSALNTNRYILNDALWLSDAIDLHCEDIYECTAACDCSRPCNCTASCACANLYAGLNSYFDRTDVSDYIAIVSSSICSDIKQLLGGSYPLLLTINTSSIDPGDLESKHTVFCYGYWETSMTTYYIVNDGWGHNSVYICADDVPSDYEIMFLI